MPLFHYSAIDKDGVEKQGTLWSKSHTTVTKKLLDRKCVIISIETCDRKSTFVEKIKSFSGLFTQPVSKKILLSFTQQLTILLQSKIPLLDSLQITLAQTKNASLKIALDSILSHLKNGSRFSQELQAFPKIFDDFYISMVICGEKSGHLEKTLPKICELIERRIRTRKSIQLAMIYPSFVISLAMTVAYLFILYVVPKFQAVFFQNTSMKVPPFTAFIFDSSRWLQEHSLSVLVTVIIVLSVIALFILKSSNQALLSNTLIKLPYIGRFFQLFTLNIFCYNLSLFLNNGIPILTALELIQKAIKFKNYQNALMAVRATLSNGIALSDALSIHHTLFPPITIHLIKIGEETGKLNGILHKLAEQFELEYQQMIKQFLTLLEPALIIALALFIGIMILSLFIPLSQLLQNSFV